MTWEWSGGQKMESKGAEAPFGTALVGLLRQAKGGPSDWIQKPPPNYLDPRSTKYAQEVGHTPNQRGLYRAYGYGWSMRFGKGSQQELWRDLLGEFFHEEFFTQGQMHGETCNSSHAQIWCNLMSGLYALAKHYGDEEIAELAARWWRREAWLYDLVEQGGHVLLPGSRSGVNNSDVRTVAYALLRGQPAPDRLGESGRPIPGQPNKENGPFWSNPWSVGCWTLRNLIRNGDDVGGAASGQREPVVLRNELYVYKRGADFLYLFPFFTKASMALWWTSRIGGVDKDSPQQRGEINGKPCPYPWPKLDVCPVVVAGVNKTPKEYVP